MKKIIKKAISKIAKPIVNKTLLFKGQHRGGSCYIFGDGISIKWFDLGSFRTKPVFTLSCIPFHKNAKILDIRYALLTQPYYFYPFVKTAPDLGNRWYRNKIKDKFIELFKTNKELNCFVSLSNYPVLRSQNIFHLFGTINDPECDYLKDCNKNGIGIYHGSLRASISLAIFMGFEEIVLVGCDYTHKNKRIGHWYEKGKGSLTKYKNYESKFFEIACKYAKIITVTKDDSGDILPGITYPEYTGRSLNYRENDEIIDMEILKLLDAYPDYKIF